MFEVPVHSPQGKVTSPSGTELDASGGACSAAHLVQGKAIMASVFISYSHKDEVLKEQLDVQLSTLKNQGRIDAWHDRKITAGDEFDSAISGELNKADIILLLVSPDFLASKYIQDVELKRAMERNKAGEARVIPVILRFCDWEATPFGKLLAAPRDGKPIKSWADPDEAFLDVVKMIRAALPPAQKVVKRKLAFKIKSPGDAHSIFPLPKVDKLKIGRAWDNDLVLADDLTVSRYHCIAFVLQDSLRIEDQGATNTPVINGVETKSGELKLHQVLELGETKLTLIPDD
jgi:hypothetical protein